MSQNRNTLVPLFAALCSILLICCTKSPESKTGTTSQVLNIYSWSNYFSPEMIQDFEKKAHCRVVFSHFSSNEELMAKLQGGARGYDIVVPTAYAVKALHELDLLEPLGELHWPELDKLQARFRNPSFDPTHAFSIPYSWGTTGIAVNRKKIKDSVDSWRWFFDAAQNRKDLQGQITMLDDGPVGVGIALKYLGYSYNEAAPAALAKAKDLLIKQKKWVRAYTPEAMAILESGEAALSVAYSGDTLQVNARKNPNIEYVFPKEGSELYMDSLALPRGVQSKALALEFMRFTLERKSAIAQVNHLFYSPVLDLEPQLLKLSQSAANTVFPPSGQLDRFEMLQDNPQRNDAVQKIWTEIKAI